MENIGNDRESNNQKNINPTKLESKNKDNIKLDSNGDEIIWELKRKINVFIILAYIFYFCIIVGFTYILTIYIIPNIDNWKSIFAFLFLIFGIIFLGREMYFSLNLKRMYIANNKLFINKHLGQDLELALKDCIIFTKMVTAAVNITGVSTCEINTINNHSTLYVFLESCSTNIDEASILLKPHIINHLINCDKQAYNKFKIIYQASSLKNQYDIDYKKIEQIRKEKEK